MSDRRLRLPLSLIGLFTALLAAGSVSAYPFRAPSAHPGGVDATGRIIFAGDVTGDGLGDVAWQYGTSLRVLVGQGNGTFFPPTDVPTGLMTTSADAAAADLDGDGLLDTVHVAADGSSVAILWAQGGGAFARETVALPAGTGSIPLLSDADGDLDLDIWIAGRGVALLLNEGGSFTSVASHRSGVRTVSRANLATGDVNRDGRADLVVAPLDGRDTGVDVVIAGTDPATTHAGIAAVLPVATSMDAPALVATADLDGDGDADVFLNGRRSSDGRGVSRSLLALGGGAFAAQPMVAALDRTSGATADVRSGDVDRDGDLDILVACDDSTDCRSLLLHRGNGLGGLGDAEPVGVLLATDRIELADLDCDGVLDVVGGGFGIATLLNLGDGTFEDEQSFSIAGGDIALGSLDGDAQPDLATVGAGGAQTALGRACAQPEPVCTSPPPTAGAGTDVAQCGVSFEPTLVTVTGGTSIAAAAPIGRYCWTTDLGTFVETGLPFFCSPRGTAHLEIPGGTGGRTAHLELEVTDTSGCRDTDDLEVAVSTSPEITLAVANPVVTCPGEPIELLARALDTFLPTNLVTLRWDYDIAFNSDGRGRTDDDVDAESVAVSGNVAVVSTVDRTPGLHVARLTAIGEDSDLCLATADVEYRVINAPRITSIQVDTTTCADRPFTFRAQALGGEPPVLLAWDFDVTVDTDGNGDPADDIQDVGEEVLWTYGIAGTYTVRAAAIDVNGCPVLTERTVTALQPPHAAFTSTSPVCDTPVVSFQDASTGIEPLTVSWTFGDGTPSVVSRTPTHVYARTGTFTVTQTVLDGRGCTTVNLGRVFVGTGEIALVSHEVQDGQAGTGTSGNGNGFAEPGERIALVFVAENRGTETVTDIDISVRVVSPSFGAEVLRASAEVLALNPGDRRTTQSPQIEIELAASYPCGTSLILEVTTTGFASTGCSTTQQIALPTGLPSLVQVGNALRSTQTAGPSETPDTAWGGSQHFTVFADATGGLSQVRAVRHTAAGSLLGPSVPLAPSSAEQLAPRVGWSSTEQQFGVAWLERTDGASTVAFARVSPAAVLLGGVLRFSVRSQAGEPDVTWTGQAWLVAWPETEGGSSAIHARFIDANGSPVGPLQLASAAADAGAATHAAVRVAATVDSWIAVYPRTAAGQTTLQARAFASDVLDALTPIWTRDLGATRAVAPAASALVEAFILAHETTDGFVEGLVLRVDGASTGRALLGAGAAPAVSGGPGYGIVARQSAGEIIAHGIDRLGGSFGADVNVSAAAGDSRSPGVATDSTGLMLLTWADDRAVTSGVSEIFSRLLQPVGGGGCTSSTLGDLAPLPNGDGQVTVGDVVVALRVAVGLEPLTPEILARGGVAPGQRTGSVHRVIGDGRVDIGDVVVLLQVAAGQITLTR